MSNAFIDCLAMQICYRSHMNFRHLHAFVTIVDAGGFARAAGRLNLSQPALSRQIHALERELGISLFDRGSRRIHLTPEGEDLLRHSRHLLTEVASLGERARALKNGQAGHLRVGATPQVIENLLADFLTQHERRHEGVEVYLVEAGGALLGDLLESSKIHLAIMPAGDGRVSGQVLYPMCLLGVLSEGHRLSRRASLEVAELEGEPLLLLSRGFASHAWFDAACKAVPLKPRVLLESAAPQTAIALARTGRGIAVIPSPVRIPREGVRVLPILHRGAAIGRWTVAAWNPLRYLAPYASVFVKELAASVRQDYPGRNFVRRAPPLPRPPDSGA
jgi:LysR family transcriptional regulator, cyn operon transcriptional activator